ncbi:DUF4333 domain-containing protein [Nocardioides sp.]|uniref:DUF4333 domain-containing protein n=1 Tax=Nocardioides sp. TaxID=35761 RepID=UPI0027330690|nr:DUF4333 domain-containing protein [Nocardioides sp.]MDP3893165.1 DUF4333 domain-containing protein [Nocardioides sp.]
MKLVALVVQVALVLVTLTACADQSEPDRTVSRAELERKVAERFPPKGSATKVSVECDGDLVGEVDATQECTVSVNRQRAKVRVTVTEVDGEDTVIDTVPFVPAERVAQELLAALTDEGYHVEKVTCPGELPGAKGGSVTCTVRPTTGDGHVVATVTAVRGLRIDFDYQVAS